MKIARANSLKRLLITARSDTRWQEGARERDGPSGSCFSLGASERRNREERRGGPRFYNLRCFRRTRYATASKLLDGRIVRAPRQINKREGPRERERERERKELSRPLFPSFFPFFERQASRNRGSACESRARPISSKRKMRSCSLVRARTP